MQIVELKMHQSTSLHSKIAHVETNLSAQVCRELGIRAYPHRIRVVFLSALEDEFEAEECRSGGGETRFVPLNCDYI